MTTIQNLRNELRHFCGSEQYYKNPLFPMFAYTEGVQYLAQKANCYWLINQVFGCQFIEELKDEAFQAWKLTEQGESAATIVVDDGNKKILKTFELDYTDFPFEVLCSKGEGFNIWFVENILLLPNEY